MSYVEARTQKLGAIAGFTAPVLAFTCILVSIVSYPKFSWTGNALSDLGVVKGFTGPLFNFGLYTSGFLGLVFAVCGLYTYVPQRAVWKIGSLTFALASVALIAIGAFNESFSGTHFAVSVAFFVLAPISLFILAYAYATARQKGMAFFTVGTAIVAAIHWLVQFAVDYVPDVAIPETASGLAVSTWVICLSYVIAKKQRKF